MRVGFFLLLGGLVIAVILSWIYDINPEGGMVKTEPAQELKPEETHKSSSKWKIASYINFIMIAGLIVMNIMGRNMQVRPGEIQSLLILPIQNYTDDDQLDIFISGMHSALIGDEGRIMKVISKTTSDVYKDADMTLAGLEQVAISCDGVRLYM